MKINKPNLIILLNTEEIVLFVMQLNKDLNCKILDKKIIKSKGIKNGKVIDANSSSEIIRQAIEEIEKKINHNFKNVDVISSQNDLKCINVSGFKKLNGSILKNDDVSFILNNIKKTILENETSMSLIHIFNSQFLLDDNVTDNLPIGLHGNLYTHQLTFFLVPKNDIKNIKLVFSKSNISLDKIILKNFVEGTELISNENNDSFVKIKILSETSHISYFKNSCLVYVQNFNFGFNILLRDVSKVCSLSLDNVKEIFSNINFDEISTLNQNEYLDKKYFKDELFRKINLSNIKDIVEARIKELINLMYEKNINFRSFKNNKNLIYLSIENSNISLENSNISKNFSEIFKNNFVKSENIRFLNYQEDYNEKLCISASDLINKGWEKEAIPVVHLKKSLVSRIFSSLFD